MKMSARMTMTGLLTAIVVSALSAQAEVIDLNGVSLTVSSPDALNADGYTNSSDTTAELVVDLDEAATLPATVSGNIKLVKKGSGVVTVPSQLAYVGGTEIREGFLHVELPAYLGATGSDAAPITVYGGGLDLPAAVKSASRFDRRFAVAEGCTGTIRALPSASSWTLVVDNVTFKKATLQLQSLDPDGTSRAIYALARTENSSYSSTGGANGGTMVVGGGARLNLSAGDCFGGANHQTDITLKVLEGGDVSSEGAHAPLTPKVILRGGKVISSGTTRGSTTVRKIEDILTAATWKSVDFCWRLTAEPTVDGSESVVTVQNAHLAPLSQDAVIDVQDGATLRMQTQLWPARSTSGRSLRKVGKGTLILERPLNIGGDVYVEEGTLRLSNHAYLGSVASFWASPGAKIVLDDGSVLPNVPRTTGGGFLSTAPVWFDATQIEAADGASLASVPNFGSAGGSFGAFFAGTKPGQPTFNRSGINGLPSLYFRGGSSGDALLLQTYTNHTDQTTVYLVMKWDGWTDDDGGSYYKWHGPLSLVPRAMSSEDYNVLGASDMQWAATFKAVTYAHGNGQACNMTFDGEPTAENQLLFRL